MKAGWVSLGCPKNQVDTEYMIGLLTDKYPLTLNPREAEILIINTCSFIQPATQESIDTIMEFAQYKKDKCKLLVVTGCLAQRYAEKIQGLVPEVDLWVGTGEYSRLPQLIAEAVTDLTLVGRDDPLEKKKKDVFIDNPGWIGMTQGNRVISTGNITAYLKIAEGCNNRCLFCIIPQLRGRYRSRKLADIKGEAEKLVTNGIKEIVLVAQDTTAYGQDLDKKGLFIKLLSTLDEIEGDFWIRILYTYPSRITNELLEVIKTSKHICHYLDIPLQHVQPNILKAMGREEGSEDYLALMERIRRTIPDIAIRSTFILGYPGETEKDFQDILDFLKEAKLDWVGAFPYYREEGTAAAKLKSQVHHATRKRRAKEVLMTQQRISKEKNKDLEGKKVRVLVEKPSTRPGQKSDLWIGRSYREAPEIDGFIEIEVSEVENLHEGQFVEATVLRGEAYSVRGRI